MKKNKADKEYFTSDELLSYPIDDRIPHPGSFRKKYPFDIMSPPVEKIIEGGKRPVKKTLYASVFIPGKSPAQLMSSLSLARQRTGFRFTSRQTMEVIGDQTVIGTRVWRIK